MTIPVIVDPEAQVEWDNAVAWYEAREAGVGLRFNAAVRERLRNISKDPDRFPFATAKTQTAKIIGWPYRIYFVVNHHVPQVKVVAIWEGHQKPSILRRRLS